MLAGTNNNAAPATEQALIFGPKNLAGLGKDLGKVAGSLKV